MAIAAVRHKDDSAPGLVTLEQARGRADAGLAALLGWVETYLMRGHAELGRTGAVCPFTRRAGLLDTARIAVVDHGPDDEEAAHALILAGFAALDAIPCKPGLEHFRTVIVGFPACAGPDGIAMLQRVQKRFKFFALRGNRMIGLMHPGSEAPGLWNRAFRPLRAPLPVLAIRHMVEQDAPFAARHPLLLLPYLLRFPLAGTRRLYGHFRGGG